MKIQMILMLLLGALFPLAPAAAAQHPAHVHCDAVQDDVLPLYYKSGWHSYRMHDSYYGALYWSRSTRSIFYQSAGHFYVASELRLSTWPYIEDWGYSLRACTTGRLYRENVYGHPHGECFSIFGPGDQPLYYFADCGHVGYGLHCSHSGCRRVLRPRRYPLFCFAVSGGGLRYGYYGANGAVAISFGAGFSPRLTRSHRGHFYVSSSSEDWVQRRATVLHTVDRNFATLSDETVRRDLSRSGLKLPARTNSSTEVPEAIRRQQESIRTQRESIQRERETRSTPKPRVNPTHPVGRRVITPPRSPESRTAPAQKPEQRSTGSSNSPRSRGGLRPVVNPRPRSTAPSPTIRRSTKPAAKPTSVKRGKKKILRRGNSRG